MLTKAGWSFACGMLILLTTSTPSVAQLKLYDNFSSKHIDPAKWIGEPASISSSDADRREVSVGLVGQQQSRQLRISQTNYSAITDNNGSSGNGFGLGFAQPSQVTAVSFDLAVDGQLVGCGGNATFGTAGYFGEFFNPTGGNNGQTGDVVASIAVGRFSTDSGTAFDVGASVSQCEDSKCNTQTTLSFQDLGPVQAGSTNKLSAEWDQPNHQFVFRLNNGASVMLQYSLNDSFPPGLADRSLFVFGSVPHCTTAPRPFASLDALFGKVYVSP